MQFILQILLLFPQLGMLRVPLRGCTFGLSLVSLVVLKGREKPHPATPLAHSVLIIVTLSLLLHPGLNSLLAGTAQWVLYLAILAPLYWVSRLSISLDDFRRLILILWGFHSLSALTGVLQVYFPGQFQPALSLAIQQGPLGGEHLLITLASGIQIYRPMGLTDSPGGAAMAGFYALLFGIGLWLEARHPLIRAACVTTSVMGLFCIYLSQVRSILIFALICLLILAIMLLLQGQMKRVSTVLLGGTTIAFLSFWWAIALGGEATLSRLSTLFSQRADLVYYQNRGHFLASTFNDLLLQHPLGAGLGRWGMMNAYFGDNSNPLTRQIWVEIQWTGWLLDGGIPLMVAYSLALLVVCYVSWRIALYDRKQPLMLWGSLLFAYNVGVLAILFNAPLFIGQGGMDFWLLNAALYRAASQPSPAAGEEPSW